MLTRTVHIFVHVRVNELVLNQKNLTQLLVFAGLLIIPSTLSIVLECLTKHSLESTEWEYRMRLPSRRWPRRRSRAPITRGERPARRAGRSRGARPLRPRRARGPARGRTRSSCGPALKAP